MEDDFEDINDQDLKLNNKLIKPYNKKAKSKRQYYRRPNIIHFCKFCSKTFQTGEMLKKHLKNHSSFECQYCGKVLARIKAWETHLNSFHNVEIKLPADREVCEKILQSVDCKICQKKFQSKPALAYHMKLHDGKTYSCQICFKNFKHPKTLKNHMLCHEDKKFICTKCNQGFNTNFALMMHDNQTHIQAKSWKCTLCDSSFTRCSSYHQHLKIHRESKSFSCEKCGESFCKKTLLRAHMKSNHSKNSINLKCNICGVICLNKVSLEKHKQIHQELNSTNIHVTDEILDSPMLQGTFLDSKTNIDSIKSSDLTKIDEINSKTDIENVDDNYVDMTSGEECIIVLSDLDTNISNENSNKDLSKEKSIISDDDINLDISSDNSLSQTQFQKDNESIIAHLSDSNTVICVKMF